MSSDYGRHVSALRDRARRPDMRNRDGRRADNQAAIDEYLSDLDDMEDE